MITIEEIEHAPYSKKENAKYSCLYVLKTKRIHSSGFKIMEIVGAANGKYEKISESCDVICLTNLISNEMIRIDIEKNGIIRILNDRGFIVKYSGESCCFDIL